MNPKTVSILCINDFHAEIFATESAPGCAKLAALVASYKAKNPNTVVVFGGDNFRGDPVSEQLSGEPVTYFMKSLGAQVSAVGNHEFDYSMQQLRAWSQQGQFTFVAANVWDKQTGKIAGGFKPYAMVEVGDVKIALIGLSTAEPLDRPNYSEDVRALEIVDGTREARKWVDYLNSGEDRHHGKPDVILALTHYGLKYAADHSTLIGDEVIELCHQVPELAGVYTAHWHQFLCVEINRVPVVQGGGNGRGFSVLTVQLSPDNRVQQVMPQFLDYSHTLDDISPDEAMRQQLEAYKQQAMKELGVVLGRLEQPIVHKTIGTAEVDMEGTPLTKLAIDVMREETGSSIALMYSGRMGLGLPEGEVTLYHLLKLLLFNDQIITMKLKGKDLIKNIENGICTLKGEKASPIALGGVHVVADYSKPYKSRIESIVLEDGQPLELDRYYPIAVDEFIASNEMGYDFQAAIDWRPTGVYLRDSIIEAIKRAGTLAAEYSGCLSVKNKPFMQKETGIL